MTESLGRARLLGRTGEFADVTQVIDAQATIGRSAGNDVVLNNPILSSRHARIFFKEGDYWLEDLGSRNGTRLDGVSVTAPERLGRLHVITLADTVDLLYVRGEDSTAPVPPAAARASRGTYVTEVIGAFEEPVVIPPRAQADPPPRPSALSSAPEPALPAPPIAPPPSPPPPSRPEETRYDLDFSSLIDPRGLERRAEPAPAPPIEYDLVLVRPDGSQQVFALKPGDNVLGRAADCDVTLPDPEHWLSRRHALLSVRPEGIRLTDNSTINGTFVKDTRIESAAIEAGVTIRLGPQLVLTLVRR